MRATTAWDLRSCRHHGEGLGELKGGRAWGSCPQAPRLSWSAGFLWTGKCWPQQGDKSFHLWSESGEDVGPWGHGQPSLSHPLVPCSETVPSSV